MGERAFELGLALAGSVSAGAYTAGALDFLIEALDAWGEAKRRDAAAGTFTVPRHRVVLRAVAGASGGGMSGALLARMLCGEREENSLLREAWVERIGAEELLGNGNANGKPIASLLDATALERTARELLAARLQPRVRAWIADPMELDLCVTNLRGTTRSIAMGGATGAGHVWTGHADCLRFAMGGRPVANAAMLDRTLSDAIGWAHLAEAALACGAFPLLLPPRFIPKEGYWAVDGGVTDNEPIELASGALARFREEAGDSEAISLLIDPFIGFPPAAAPASEAMPGLFAQVLMLMNALINQSRCKPEEPMPSMHSGGAGRFLLAPVRDSNGGKLIGGAALASGCLAGFSGFLSKRFREHDYLLGRRNCQQFLRNHFTHDEEGKMIRIIPLMNHLNPDLDPRHEIPLPPWDSLSLRAVEWRSLEELIKQRAAHLARRLAAAPAVGAARRFMLRTALAMLGRHAARALCNAIAAALCAGGLMETRSRGSAFPPKPRGG